MIAHLIGTVLHKTAKTCILGTSGGVGYEVHVPQPLLQGLATGQPLTLFIQTIVREDALDLFGFVSMEERELFGLILSVHQLGPKTGLAILSTLGPDGLKQAVDDEDTSALVRVPGVGEKTAKRIIWDLKDRFRKAGLSGLTLGTKVGGKPHGVFSDALAALVNLGYKDDEVTRVVKAALTDEPDLDAAGAIRAALKRLSAARKA